MNMASLGLISNMYIINILLLIVSGLMMIGAIVLGIKVGQGGERLKEGSKEETPSNYDIDDDDLWIFGNSLYYNPDDSSLFVEKRVGVGWTVNIGRPIGMIIMILPFITLIVLLFRINK